MNLKDVVKPKLYTSKEVAEFMSISTRRLFRLVKSGKLKAINIAYAGDKPIYNFSAEAVQEYYDGLQVAVGGDQVLDE